MGVETNYVLGFEDWTDKVTFSAGSYAAGYPVTNLGVLPLAAVARSADAALASTIIVGTLDKQRPVRLVALCNHNISRQGKYRLRLWSDAVMTDLLYDSGSTFIDALPVVFATADLEFEDPRWWDGKYGAEDLDGARPSLAIWLPSRYLARAFKLEIDDTANADLYVQAGYLAVTAGWQVGVNLEYGTQFGWRPRTAVAEADGGVKYFDRKDKPRVLRGQIRYLPRSEALARGYELQRVMDLDRPFFVLRDPTDTLQALRESCLMRHVDLGLMAYAFVGRMTLPLNLEEAL